MLNTAASIIIESLCEDTSLMNAIIDILVRDRRNELLSKLGVGFKSLDRALYIKETLGLSHCQMEKFVKLVGIEPVTRHHFGTRREQLDALFKPQIIQDDSNSRIFAATLSLLDTVKIVLKAALEFGQLKTEDNSTLNWSGDVKWRIKNNSITCYSIFSLNLCFLLVFYFFSSLTKAHH